MLQCSASHCKGFICRARNDFPLDSSVWKRHFPLNYEGLSRFIMVSIRYTLPDPSLFDFVAAIGEAEIADEGRVTDIAPPDMTMISVSLSGQWLEGRDRADTGFAERVVLHGPTSRAKWLSGENSAAIAIALHPLCWPVWFGRKASDFADRTVPLTAIGLAATDRLLPALEGCESFSVRTAAINRWLLDLPRRDTPVGLQGQVMAMRMALADPDCASVDELARRVRVSQSRLARLATSCFGFTPKLLIQIARFRRMLHRADAHSYAAWRTFIESQYVDQSHLIRDFQRFLGLSPSAYFQLERPFVAAAFAEARRLLGATPMESDWKLAAE